MSPDFSYIASGSEDGLVYVWSFEGDNMSKEEIDVSVEGPVSCVAWNPKYHMMAVSCS